MSKEDSFEQFNELSRVTTGITKRTTEYMVDMVNGFFGDTAKTWSELSNIKKMEDVITAQARIASEMGNKFMKCSQQALSLWQGNSSDISRFMEHYGRSVAAAHPMNIMNPSKPTAAGSEKKG